MDHNYSILPSVSGVMILNVCEEWQWTRGTLQSCLITAFIGHYWWLNDCLWAVNISK